MCSWICSNNDSDNSSVSSDIEAENSTNNDSQDVDEKEKRSNLIQSRLVFQQVILLPSKNNKKVKQSKRRRNSNESCYSNGRRYSNESIETRNTSCKRDDLEMACDNDDTEDKINNNINNRQNVLTSSVQSYITSIKLLVFFNHNDEGGSTVEETRVSQEALKEQPCCSICLDDYSVGDIVVRLKTKASGNTHGKEAGAGRTCNHCFHEQCILEWLENHDECPLCRVNMVHG
eukprot:CAMPEP_0168178644 /NCGR_PEP_ID=MMETSP0139_2-20121125/9294_1 /TAXON_ID=44445 /ORGANISM="Pseudo-nitzschia australis, Strain 10249 10 AB" /LENGTH=231 /DNA_ID=CAMNT_0008098169 /DNA_START=141 /DNA_END=836 /DNA_ORIENTATION=+